MLLQLDHGAKDEAVCENTVRNTKQTAWSIARSFTWAGFVRYSAGCVLAYKRKLLRICIICQAVWTLMFGVSK